MKNFLLLLFLTSLQVITAQNKKPFILGQIDEIQSTVLAENRILNIYLPEGYSENEKIKYPVIYLLDGSTDEDFIHIAGLVNFSTFPWVNKLENSILVGIANVDRKRDLTFTTTIKKDAKDFPTAGHSDKFISFIETELQPYIEKNYRTNNHKTIIGQSLGGLLATEILFKKPQLFNNYIIVSPSLWWDNESLLKTDPKTFRSVKDIFVYLAVGVEGDIMINDVKKLHDILKESNNTKAQYEYFGNEDHGSILHSAVYNAFNFLPRKK